MSLRSLKSIPRLPGLIGHWSGDGNALDSVGGHNGTLYGTASYGAGKFGQAFDITQDYSGPRVRIEDSPAFVTPSFTVSGWTYARSWLGQVIVRGDSRPGRDPYTVTLYDSGSLGFVLGTDTGAAEKILAPFSLNAWTHFAATFDDATGQMSLYLDGILRAQTTTLLKPNMALAADFSPGIGFGNVAETSNHFPMNGLIDEVSIFSRALSPEEIAIMVPEPSVAALAAFGGLALCLRKRKQGRP